MSTARHIRAQRRAALCLHPMDPDAPDPDEFDAEADANDEGFDEPDAEPDEWAADRAADQYQRELDQRASQ